MTREEAKKIANIMRTADGGCPHCAWDLIGRMIEAFPDVDFDWVRVLAESEDSDAEPSEKDIERVTAILKKGIL